MAYAFGSSTPRDFTFLEHVPYKYRVYDVRIRSPHLHHGEPTLSDYMREAREDPQHSHRHRDRSLDSHLKRMYVFGSSTPRELTYMEHVDPRYRIYDTRLPSSAFGRRSRRSQTTSFSPSDKNRHRTPSTEGHRASRGRSLPPRSRPPPSRSSPGGRKSRRHKVADSPHRSIANKNGDSTTKTVTTKTIRNGVVTTERISRDKNGEETKTRTITSSPATHNNNNGNHNVTNNYPASMAIRRPHPPQVSRLDNDDFNTRLTPPQESAREQQQQQEVQQEEIITTTTRTTTIESSNTVPPPAVISQHVSSALISHHDQNNDGDEMDEITRELIAARQQQTAAQQESQNDDDRSPSSDDEQQEQPTATDEQEQASVNNNPMMTQSIHVASSFSHGDDSLGEQQTTTTTTTTNIMTTSICQDGTIESPNESSRSFVGGGERELGTVLEDSTTGGHHSSYDENSDPTQQPQEESY